MNRLTNYLIVSISIILLASCGSISKNKQDSLKEEPVVIKNDSVEYEITIIDPGQTKKKVDAARPKTLQQTRRAQMKLNRGDGQGIQNMEIKKILFQFIIQVQMKSMY